MSQKLDHLALRGVIDVREGGSERVQAVALSLALGSAVCYVLATYGMKLFSTSASMTAFFIIAFTLAGAATLEIFALKIERVGFMYIAILGIETVLIALVSIFILGESFSAREFAGLGGIIIGLALLST